MDLRKLRANSNLNLVLTPTPKTTQFSTLDILKPRTKQTDNKIQKKEKSQIHQINHQSDKKYKFHQKKRSLLKKKSYHRWAATTWRTSTEELITIIKTQRYLIMLEASTKICFKTILKKFLLKTRKLNLISKNNFWRPN